jgi:hypothetical protein
VKAVTRATDATPDCIPDSGQDDIAPQAYELTLKSKEDPMATFWKKSTNRRVRVSYLKFEN